ncbi:MAG: Fe-S cluster assembly scaffold protein NifU [Candidatus Krumholzibacteriota bacterium]|nr:Fe-S cluster assembly scaffold protein NifU [Candidatus Krumholzibacteriota bacterium]
MALYSDKVMDHFMNPRNVGDLEKPDGVGEVGNPTCGDMMTFMISVKDDRIADIRFKTFGCGAAIAVSSMVSEMALGKTLDEAMEITNEMVAEELGGLPTNKLHCSNLGADALHAAIEDYRKRLETGEPAEVPELHEVKRSGKDKQCPYCDADIDASSMLCNSCKTSFDTCPHCGKIADRSREKCPHCGASIHKHG